MAATDPYKVTDLIHKYGWDFLGYMANLGVNLPGNAQVIFVDSNATNASDADDAVHGHSFENPIATLDYAIGLCTDGQGDVILIAPGHTENLASATACVCDISDLTIVGLGTGVNRPTFSLATLTTAKISVTAANVTIKNIRLVSALADMAVGIDLEAGADGFWIEDCYISDGNNIALELVIGITITADCNDVTIKNCRFHTVTGGGCASAINVESDSDRLRIEGCEMFGYYSTSCIDANQNNASLEISVRDNILMNIGGGNVAMEFVTTTTGVLVRNMVGQVSGTVDAAIVGEDKMYLWENYEVDTYAVYAIIAPATTAA